MKAVLFDKKSSTERLTYSDVEKPIPKDNELLVEICIFRFIWTDNLVLSGH